METSAIGWPPWLITFWYLLISEQLYMLMHEAMTWFLQIQRYQNGINQGGHPIALFSMATTLCETRLFGCIMQIIFRDLFGLRPGSPVMLYTGRICREMIHVKTNDLLFISKLRCWCHLIVIFMKNTQQRFHSCIFFFFLRKHALFGARKSCLVWMDMHPFERQLRTTMRMSLVSLPHQVCRKSTESRILQALGPAEIVFFVVACLDTGWCRIQENSTLYRSPTCQLLRPMSMASCPNWNLERPQELITSLLIFSAIVQTVLRAVLHACSTGVLSYHNSHRLGKKPL